MAARTGAERCFGVRRPFIAESSPAPSNTRMNFRIGLLAVWIAWALCAPGAAAAWSNHGSRDNSQSNSQSTAQGNSHGDNGLPASVRRIERETGGEVLKAQPIQRDGREVYRVKVLTPQGRLRVVEDAPPARDQAPPRDTQDPSSKHDHQPED